MVKIKFREPSFIHLMGAVQSDLSSPLKVIFSDKILLWGGAVVI